MGFFPELRRDVGGQDVGGQQLPHVQRRLLRKNSWKKLKSVYVGTNPMSNLLACIYKLAFTNLCLQSVFIATCSHKLN